MTAPPGYDPGPWQEAVQAAYLLAIEPRLGAVLRARPGPAREAWLRLLAGLLPDAPWQRVPAQVDAAGLLGGLDLAATLAAGRPLATRGVLAAADGGCVVLATAERLGATALGIIAGALDTQSVTLERDGMTRHCAARFAVVALDESYADEAPLATALADRLALVLALDGVRVAAGLDELPDPAAVVAARAQLPSVRADDAHIEALVAAAAALGIGSLRPLQAAVLAARAAAALDGATRLDEAHLALAVRLVLLPRARCVPGDAAADTEPAEAPPPEAGGDTTPRDDAAPPPPADEGADAESSDAAGQGAPEDAILAAAAAALPAGLLAQIARLGAAGSGARAGRASGRARAPRRGRPIGSRPGQPRGGARLDLVATLRAAAPWQRLRAQAAAPRARVAVREEDFRVTRFKARTVITTIFVVDASGSSAAHRLAEAKGAVELLLAECYVRRDRVALVAFRGAGASVVLPPTRSLVRARRELARLPAGGGTPLAAGLECALGVADGCVRDGSRAQLVVLTDGRPNVGLDGRGGAAAAMHDALAMAGRIRAARHAALLLDVAPRPRPFTAECATRMGATFLALPRADAAALAAAASSGSAPRARSA